MLIIVLWQVWGLQHCLSFLERLIIQICKLFVFFVLVVVRGGAIVVGSRSTLAFLVDAGKEIGGHGLSLAHFLLAMAGIFVAFLLATIL